MPKHINSASRLSGLLEKIQQFPVSHRTLDVWANVFHIEERSEQRTAVVVAERLGSLHTELDLIRIKMAEKNFSATLYSAALEKLENAFSIIILNSTWNSAAQYLTPDVFGNIAFCGEIIADEESAIDTEELKLIEKSVEELASSLAGTTLPDRLKALIHRHIAMIRRALSEYPITGAKAFRLAAHSALGEILDVKDEISDFAETVEITLFGAMWGQVNKTVHTAFYDQTGAPLALTNWSILKAIETEAGDGMKLATSSAK